MTDRLSNTKRPTSFMQKYGLFATCMITGLVVIPGLYFAGQISIEQVNLYGRYMTFAIVALGLDLVWGYTGVLSLCQALFFALGGYAMGMYLAHHGGAGGAEGANGWDIPACLYVVYPYKVGQAPADATLPWFWKASYWLPCAVALGIIIPGIVSAIIGYFGFKSRVRGVYFSILSQAITVAAWLVFCMNNMFFCGTNGLTNFKTIAGFDINSTGVKLGLYVVSFLSLVAVYFGCRHIVKSRLGRILVAIRDDESTLRFSGYHPYIYKTFAFSIGGMIAGYAGVLYAAQQTIFAPAEMEAAKSILIVVWVAVGGRGTLKGAIAGALTINILYNTLTSSYPELWPYILGGLFVAVVLLFPRGLVGLAEDFWESLRGVVSRKGDSAPATEGTEVAT